MALVAPRHTKAYVVLDPSLAPNLECLARQIPSQTSVMAQRESLQLKKRGLLALGEGQMEAGLVQQPVQLPAELAQRQQDSLGRPHDAQRDDP